MSSQINLQGIDNSQHRWFDSALGKYVQQEEQALYDKAVVDLFGFNALQMGCLQMDLLRNSRIANRFKSSDTVTPMRESDLFCCDDFLPIADASLDLLLLPHRLEFSERPHQTLREAERVMMPEGHLLITGFNPFSFWGVVQAFKKLLSGKAGTQTFPWSGKFIGLTRLKDWLALMGFEVVSVEMCCHMLPLEQEVWRRRFGFMSKLCSRCIPVIGGVYFIVAKKRVVSMTPLRPNWKKATLNSTLVVRPTQRKPSQRHGLKPHDKNHCEQ